MHQSLGHVVFCFENAPDGIGRDGSKDVGGILIHRVQIYGSAPWTIAFSAVSCTTFLDDAVGKAWEGRW